MSAKNVLRILFVLMYISYGFTVYNQLYPERLLKEGPLTGKQIYREILNKMAAVRNKKQPEAFPNSLSISEQLDPQLGEESKERVSRYLNGENVLCETLITRGVFYEEGYEYRPTQYYNLTCAETDEDPFAITNPDEIREFCYVRGNFGCQTHFEEMSIYKRKHGYECWEHTTQLVAVGCKCNIGFKYY